VVVVNAKTAGIAVLLTFLWLGAGHLYAGRTSTGVPLIILDLCLVVLAMIPLLGWILAPMIWFPCFIVAAISASAAVKTHNARWGITEY
jgi:hypothetical protein